MMMPAATLGSGLIASGAGGQGCALQNFRSVFHLPPPPPGCPHSSGAERGQTESEPKRYKHPIRHDFGLGAPAAGTLQTGLMPVGGEPRRDRSILLRCCLVLPRILTPLQTTERGVGELLISQLLLLWVPLASLHVVAASFGKCDVSVSGGRYAFWRTGRNSWWTGRWRCCPTSRTRWYILAFTGLPLHFHVCIAFRGSQVGL